MTKDELVKLAERCEAASGSNRELDQDIHEIVVIQSALSGTIYPYCKRYTASIDSAMTLVPEGKVWSVNFDPRLSRGFISAQDGFDQIHTLAATPALALCAASLRARATTTGEAK